MGQVPASRKQNPSPFYALLGSGRLALHLSHYFDLLAIPYSQWARHSLDKFNSFSPSQWPNPYQRMQLTIEKADVILLATSDSSLQNLMREIPRRDDQILVHFSGALSFPEAESAHPLMTFGPDLYSFEEYKKIPFILESGRRPFSALFPELPNLHFEIPRELKPLYHAFCVMSGNFTQILWSELLGRVPRQLGLPREVFLPYMQQVFANLVRHPETSATGPLVRRDLHTIAQHLEALRDTELTELYQAFLRLKQIDMNRGEK